MSPRPDPPDKAERDRAIASRANLAVTAGAGTGKTTLLVRKILQKVLGEGVPIERILALTFTEKAANEMKLRLRQGFRKENRSDLLEPLERAEIGTIHSFCAHLLRQFPVESGVAPDFEVDDGPIFRRRFDEAWPRWLDGEIGPVARRPNVWKEVLAEVSLPDLRGLAEALASFAVPAGRRQSGAGRLAELVKEFSKKVPKLAPALEGKAEPQKTIKGGPVEKAALRLAQDIAKVDDRLVGRALSLAEEFALEFRRDFLRAGYVSFDGILHLVHDLLDSGEFKGVRKIVRGQFDYILVDEFQDTDPVQGEIIRKLAEDGKGKLVPNRLFLVGDPKQSIYSFRGADIVAFETLRKKILEEGGERVTLSTNFRSHKGILDFVNASFSRLIVKNGDLQPDYERIDPAVDAARKYPGPAVEAVLIENAGAEESREMEAEEVAHWIEARNKKDKVPYREIAILLRSLVNVAPYLDALRGRKIPYVVEGEKYFYNTIEVIDFINLLRAVANPHDRIAAAGLLRSPYGAVPDQVLYERRRSLDYRLPSPWPIFAFLKRWNEASGRLGVTELIDRIFEESYALEIAQSGHSGEQAVANLLKLRQKAADLEAKGGCTLREFLEGATLAVRELEEEGESPLADETLDAVKILSIHRSKGLEFPVVVLPDLHRQKQARKTPTARYDWPTGVLGVSLGDRMDSGAAALAHNDREREREEWRRLLYVAMTRAGDRLLLLGSAQAREETFLGLLRDDLGGHAAVTSKPYVRPAFRPPPAAEHPKAIDWDSFVATWRDREKRSVVEERITSPSRLEKAAAVDRALYATEAPDAPSRASELGTVCHAVLEHLDFKAPAIPESTDPEAARILEKFFKSPPFRELAKAEILARELPFVIPRGGRIVQGVIDVIYRAAGKVYVADYKTDKLIRPEDYGLIREIYSEAARRILKVEPGFKLIYLRQGRAVET